jgi:hypothetical protein
MFSRSLTLGFLAILLVAWQASSQTTKRDCGDAGTMALSVAFDDSYSSATLAYQLSDPKKFSTVQIEVWDRPKLLFQAQAPLRPKGQIVWTPKQEPADTPLALWIRVDDPELKSSGFDPTAMVGTTGPDEGGSVPELFRQSVVFEEGTESPTVTVAGKNLGEHNTHIMLLEEESPQVWIVREYLPAVLADLEHVSVQIPSGYILKPTVLRLEALRPGDESGYEVGTQAGGNFNYVVVHVTSKDRPILTSVEPSSISAGNQTGGAVRILGNGFTNESQVLVSDGGGIDFSYPLKPVFISPHELQVPSSQLGRSYPIADLQLWVRNGDDRHVSDPQTLRLLPTSEFPLAGARRPSIISVSPYPVPLMDQRSRTGILLKVYGENFRNGDTVIAENGELDGNLKTEFVSPQQLNAWLPREVWRSHRLSFRLVTQGAAGKCAAEVWQDW